MTLAKTFLFYTTNILYLFQNFIKMYLKTIE